MKQRILIVDDDAAILAGLHGVLSYEGYEVIEAIDGHEATRVFWDKPADLVLVDLNMPVKNGWQTIERLKEIKPTMPIIIITAQPDQFGQAQAARVDALLEKPLDIPYLLQTVEELLAESKLERLDKLANEVQNPVVLPSLPMTHQMQVA